MDSSTRFTFMYFILMKSVLGNDDLFHYNSYGLRPDYARSMPGLVPGSDGIYSPRPQPLRQSESSLYDWTSNDAHGFHLDGELEARSLDSPQLSAIFNKPVSTADLTHFALSRLQSPQHNHPQPSTLPPTPPSTTPLILSPTIELGDYSSPYFRPIYAKPPPPDYPQKQKSKKEHQPCECICTPPPTPTTTQLPVEVTKPTTRPTTSSPTSGYEPVSVRLTVATTTEKPVPETVEEMINEAFKFKGTRIIDHPTNDDEKNKSEKNGLHENDVDETKNSEIEPSTQSPTTSTKTLHSFRVGKQISEIPFSGLFQQKARRTSMRDLTVPRGILKV